MMRKTVYKLTRSKNDGFPSSIVTVHCTVQVNIYIYIYNILYTRLYPSVFNSLMLNIRTFEYY